MERNALRRLPRVPSVPLNGCFFTEQLGWVVGDAGVILHTRDAGRTWQVQTNVEWGVPSEGRQPSRARAQNSIPDGPKEHRYLASFLALLALALFGGKRLVEHLNQQVQDSEDFRDALARWSKRIAEAIRPHARPSGWSTSCGSMPG